MSKTQVLVLLTAFAVGMSLLAETGYAHQLAAVWAIPANAADRFVSVQYGPGSGTGTGGDKVVRCRIVRIPGSGMGPRRVCERVPRCRIVRIPGSGRGPQRVCD